MANVRSIAHGEFFDAQQGAFIIIHKGNVSIKRLWVPSRDQKRTNEVSHSRNLLRAETAIF